MIGYGIAFRGGGEVLLTLKSLVKIKEGGSVLTSIKE